jgi:phosphatidate phosphatase APP1
MSFQRWLPYFVSALIGINLTAMSALGQASTIKPDEQVLLYPTIARLISGEWRMNLHGIIYEPEARPLMLPAIRKLTGLDEKDLSPAESAIFNQRVRHFLADNERGEKLSTVIGGKTVSLGTSGANGHFNTSILWRTNFNLTANNGLIPVLLPFGGDNGRQVPLEIHLLGENGVSVISDIDDTIKISEVPDKQALMRNTFCRPFKPVTGMADVYRAWAASCGAKFHYVTASPWQLYLPLSEFTRSNGFPAGTFHMKEFRVKDGSVLNVVTSQERYKPGVIEPLLRQFPKRHFVLVGDSGEQDPEIYGAFARKYPAQIRRILIRDVTGEGRSSQRYERAFARVPPERWLIFKEAVEIKDSILSEAVSPKAQ